MLPYLHFFSFNVYLFLAVYILLKKPRAYINRICAASFICFGMWAGTMVFVHNPQTSLETTVLVSNIACFGWASFGNFYFLFTLALTGKEKIFKKPWFIPAIFFPALLTIFWQWKGVIFSQYINVYYGWKGVFSDHAGVYFFFFYSFVFMAAGLYLNGRLIKNSPHPVQKKQARIIFWSVLISLTFGATTDVIFPLTNVQVIPDMASFLLMAWAMGVVYAMVKYKFLAISPTTAAGNIIATMFDSLVLLDMEGKIVFTNKATQNLLDYKEKELAGKAIDMIFAEEEQQEGVVAKIYRKENLKNRDFLFKTKNGKPVPVLFSSSLLRDETGGPAGYVCVARDITERKKLESEILKSKKLESIGLLAGGIAHDFNNLLSIIMGNLSIVLDELEPGQRIHNALRRAEEASVKATNLAAKFIAFAPGGLLERVKIDLSSLFLQVKSSMELDRGITLDISLPADIEAVFGDEKQLTLLIENLFRNAVEAMPHGGRIRVRAENCEFDEDSKLMLKKGQYVKVEIIDTGVGVSPENMERIFDPYFSTKERMAQKGMGLGLTICYSIIKKHEGHIVFESKEGEGARVTLYLPIYAQGGRE